MKITLKIDKKTNRIEVIFEKEAYRKYWKFSDSNTIFDILIASDSIQYSFLVDSSEDRRKILQTPSIDNLIEALKNYFEFEKIEVDDRVSDKIFD